MPVYSPHFLLIEDDPNDAFLTQEAFEQLAHPPHFSVYSDGLAAQEYLLELVQSGASLPDLILLDLNMPRMDGFTFLKWVKSQGSLSHIPVLILSTSNSPDDIQKSYSYFASSYLCKPRAFGEYGELTQAVEQFWLKTARLPPHA